MQYQIFFFYTFFLCIQQIAKRASNVMTQTRLRQTNWNGGWFWRFLSGQKPVFIIHLWNENFAYIPCISLKTRLRWLSPSGEFSDLHSIFRLRALRYSIARFSFWRARMIASLVSLYSADSSARFSFWCARMIASLVYLYSADSFARFSFWCARLLARLVYLHSADSSTRFSFRCTRMIASLVSPYSADSIARFSFWWARLFVSLFLCLQQVHLHAFLADVYACLLAFFLDIQHFHLHIFLIVYLLGS